MQVCDNEIKNVNDIQSIEYFEFIIHENAKLKKIEKAFEKRFEDFSHCIEFKGFKRSIKSKELRKLILIQSAYLFFIRAYEDPGYEEELEIDEILFLEIVDFAKDNF